MRKMVKKMMNSKNEKGAKQISGWATAGCRWLPRVARRRFGRSTNFNAALDDPDGSLKDSDFEADRDIQVGNVKSFTSVDDMIASLKQPW